MQDRKPSDYILHQVQMFGLYSHKIFILDNLPGNLLENIVLIQSTVSKPNMKLTLNGHHISATID